MLSAMLYAVVANGGEGAEGAKILAEAKAAAYEPLQGLAPAVRAKLVRRIDRASAEAMREVEGATVGKAGLVVFELVRMIVESGYLVLAEGSAFDRAMNNVLAHLDPLAASAPTLHASASKQARRALARLQAQGYYQGVTL